MLKRTKIRLAAGATAATALIAGAITTAYASPWRHEGRSASYSRSSAQPTANVATATTTIQQVASTVPGNGDVNPYGVAIVPHSEGNLVRGDVLVSNFNNKANAGGTGTSIVEINPATGRKTLFAWLTPRNLPSNCPGGVGLTTALTVLRTGWVVVGSLPTMDGTPNTLHSGCLIVLNSRGRARWVITGHGIKGPWDMTAVDWGDHAELFVSNVLNGIAGSNGARVMKGSVVRLDLSLSERSFWIDRATTVASGFPEQASNAALIQGPTGLALVGSTLYVADTLGNRIAGVRWATTRRTSAGLGSTLAEEGLIQGPLGLTALPTGTLLVANGNNGNLVAVTQRGKVALVKALDTTAVAGSMPGAGSLFGVASSWDGRWAFFVDDLSNTLRVVGPLTPRGTRMPPPVTTPTPTPTPTGTMPSMTPTPSPSMVGTAPVLPPQPNPIITKF